MVLGVLTAVFLLGALVIGDLTGKSNSGSTAGYGCLFVIALAVLAFIVFLFIITAIGGM